MEGHFHGLSHWLVRAWQEHLQDGQRGRLGKLARSVVGVLAPQARAGGEVRPQPLSSLLVNQTPVAVGWLQLEGHKVNSRGLPIHRLPVLAELVPLPAQGPGQIPLIISHKHYDISPPVFVPTLSPPVTHTPECLLPPCASPQPLPEAFSDSYSDSDHDCSPSPGSDGLNSPCSLSQSLCIGG